MRAKPKRQAEPVEISEERLRVIAGQLFLTGFQGKEPTSADVVRVANDVRDGKVAGVIINDSNIVSFSQLRLLTEAIAGEGGENMPLIGIDQPGGPDSVLSEDKGFTFYSAANAVSSVGNASEAHLIYSEMARELAALGITLNIGPSGDLCREEGVNLSAPCFGTRPANVASFAMAFSAGHHEQGVQTALRLAPPRAGLKSAIARERPSTIMVRRLVAWEPSDALVVRVKALEVPDLPDGFLGISQTDVYRVPHFGGVLIFELDMGLSGAPIRYEDVITRAFRSGADMILLRDPSGLQAGLGETGFEALRNGLQTKRLKPAMIEAAYRRVQRLKERLRDFQPKTQMAGIDR